MHSAGKCIYHTRYGDIDAFSDTWPADPTVRL